MPEFVHAETSVIDHYYVIFTTEWGRHLVSGARIDPELKSTMLIINAEPIYEKVAVRIGEVTTDVWIPKVILRDSEHHNYLYQVVYDPKFVLRDPTDRDFLVELATMRSNSYDPVSRS